ncbi:MAG: DUF547 domain-containing protein [Planctomycetota bacterium]|nr:DUF547 domain-containing protein [Planctomycetota bacterium]
MSDDPQIPGSKDAQLAFWINAYNAVTIHVMHGILREWHHQSDSIRLYPTVSGNRRRSAWMTRDVPWHPVA